MTDYSQMSNDELIKAITPTTDYSKMSNADLMATIAKSADRKSVV